MAKAKKAPAKKASKKEAKPAKSVEKKSKKPKNSGSKVEAPIDNPGPYKSLPALPKVTELNVARAKNGFCIQVASGFGPKDLYIAEDFDGMVKRLKKLFKGSTE